MEKLSPTVRASLELLRVPADASAEDLKKSFYQLALLYHPDRNPDPEAPAQFRRVTEAYELLLDRPRVEQLNRHHLKERLHHRVIEGLPITFGSFFGYRIFQATPPTYKPSAHPQLTGQVKAGVAAAIRDSEPELWMPLVENNSILDHSAFDAIEVIYAGKLNQEDEERLRAESNPRGLGELPWVVINNQGIMKYLDGDLVGSRRAYRELCSRVPGNIIFTYRLAVCLIIEGFQKPVPRFLYGTRPDPKKINEGLLLLRRCVRLGEEREVGRQACLMIRKLLADILERLGKHSQARKIWKEILRQDAGCAEATYKLKGLKSARPLILDKQRRAETGDGFARPENRAGLRPQLETSRRTSK